VLIEMGNEEWKKREKDCRGVSKGSRRMLFYVVRERD
jgi:hypothetical protein